jgi:hypothetical protein
MAQLLRVPDSTIPYLNELDKLLFWVALFSCYEFYCYLCTNVYTISLIKKFIFNYLHNCLIINKFNFNQKGVAGGCATESTQVR